MTTSVFVSYTRTDQQFAHQLARDLHGYGVPVWVDQWNIPASANWRAAIQRALDTCTHFLIVLSLDAVRSQEVQHELNYAVSNRKHILPVLYQPCQMPYYIQTTQYVDFTTHQYQYALSQLIQVFNNTTHLQSSSTPSPPASSGAAGGRRSGTTAPPVTIPRRRTWVFATLIVLLLVAGGAIFVRQVVMPSFAGGASGLFGLGSTCDSSQPATESTPEGPWSSGDVNGVELIVEHIDRGLSTVQVTAKNNTPEAVRLVLFGHFVVIDDTNQTYEADPFNSNWPENGTIPACDTVSGSVVLNTQIDSSASTVRVKFTNVALGWGFNDVGVEDIPLQ